MHEKCEGTVECVRLGSGQLGSDPNHRLIKLIKTQSHPRKLRIRDDHHPYDVTYSPHK